jgi:hypothetical protein
MRVALFAAFGLALTGGQPSSVWNLEHASVASTSAPTRDGLHLLRGMAYRPDLSFENGTIEFELGAPGSMFAGVAFRMASTADYEIVYFRSSDDRTRWAGIQYQPVFAGETTWQLYHGPEYERSLPTQMGSTLRVRVAFAGDQMDVYLNDSVTPVLRVDELKRTPAAGAVGFWAVTPDGGRGTEIRNLRIDTTRVLSVRERFPAETSARQLVRWRVSDRVDAPDGVHAPAALPSGLPFDTWPVVTAETSGLVNLTKAIGNPAGRQSTNVFGGAGWGMAYAALAIDSRVERTVHLTISYSDGIGVYLNGRRLYAGDNSSDSRYEGYLGIVGNELETVDLPLLAGRNELVLAVTDKAFGWGFRAKLDTLDGLTFLPR